MKGTNIMDIKAKVEELVNKIKGDPDLLNEFKSNPVAVVEKLLGVDLPDDQLKGVVDAVKAKINLDGITSKLGGLGNLFNK